MIGGHDGRELVFNPEYPLRHYQTKDRRSGARESLGMTRLPFMDIHAHSPCSVW